MDTKGNATRVLIPIETLDVIKSALPATTSNTAAVAAALHAWYYDETLDQGLHRALYWDDPNGK